MTAAENTPTPDPTILTTEQILREVENSKKELLALINGLESLMGERLKSVATQFQLIERQRVEQKADTEKAVQAALSAAKEAVKEQTAASDKSITKSETAMTEQLKQLTATFTTANKGLTDILNDLKERVGKIESLKQGGEDVSSARSAGLDRFVAWLFGGIGLIVAAIALFR